MKGLKRLLQTVETERPRNLWISTECTAFSPIQNINQRTEAQTKQLEAQRKAHKKQHTAALIVTR